MTRIAAVLIASPACSAGPTPGDATATSATSGSGGAGGATSTSTSTGEAAGGGGNGGGGGGDACPSQGDPCTTCLAAECQATYCACYENPECLAASNCFLVCAPGDDGCKQGCLTAHAAGIADSALLGDCQVARCGLQCPPADTLSPCRGCLFRSCPDEMNACVADADCNKLLQCADQCAGDGACEDACAQSYPDGVRAAEAALACGTEPCDGLCL